MVFLPGWWALLIIVAVWALGMFAAAEGKGGWKSFGSGIGLGGASAFACLFFTATGDDESDSLALVCVVGGLVMLVLGATAADSKDTPRRIVR
ncbi:hypothetical protein ABZY81_43760 [Streptomyces sp. NPDC006514]|uniref:hypothetical protein n=1 Tax=Streptomyces sp. NPDC006514 TaxID=3154308 RepID=UPI0033A631D3